MNQAAFASARLWLITDEQYVNVVRDVLGIALTGADALITGPADTTGEFTNFAGRVPAITDALTLAYRAAAEKIASRAATPPNMTRLLGSEAPTMEQLNAFITTKIARLFRRSLTTTEVASLETIYNDAAANPADGGPPHAFDLLLEACLQVPSFLFRTELGIRTPAGTFQLTPYEVAAALSFAFTDSGPDAALWEKATNGTLSSPDVLATQVDRLMSLPSVQARLAKYVSYWLWIERVPARYKDAGFYPEYTATLKEALYQSAFAFVQDVVMTGKFSDLFTSAKIYLNAEMSMVYGIPGGTGMTPTSLEPVTITLPERSAGILTQPALLAATNVRQVQLDPIHHGIFVLENLLDTLHAPPPQGLHPAGDPPLDPPFTTERIDERQLSEERVKACGLCHGYFEGYGLTRARYDSIGRYSATRYVAGERTGPDITYFWETSPTPLDASGTIMEPFGPDQKIRIDDTPGLARYLNSDPTRKRVAYSAAKNLALFVIGHDPNIENSCTWQDVKETFYQSGSFTGFFKGLVTSPGFSTRNPK